MATDVEDNGVQPQRDAVEIDETIGPSDLPTGEEVLEAFVKVPGSGASETVSSSLISLVSSTNTIADSVYRNESSRAQAVFTSGDVYGSVSSTPEEITMTDVAFPSGLVSVFNSLDYVRNSTSPFLDASNETVPQSESYWSPEEMGAVIIVSLMVPFILLSNIIVIISVVRFRRLHTPTNYFITSLAAVDIFVALATPFGVVVEVFNFGGVVRPEDAAICLLPNRVLMMACGVSVLTLAAIAYDRQTALVSPLEYISIMTYKKVAVMVTLTWIYSAFIAWLPLMAEWYNLPSEDSPCSANLIHGKAPVLFLAAIFFPSCVAIFVCYFRIFMVAKHHAKAIAAVEVAVHRHLQVKFIIKDTKYAKTLALVIGVFLLLWLPYLIFIFVQTISGRTFNVWIQTYLILLTVFNSGINPWLYAFKNNELRAAFKRLFKELCRNKSCNFNDRRTSLISAISGTPRLSRTDSRMASIIPEVNVYMVDEKLKQSLDSLNRQISQSKHGGDGTQQRRQSMVNLMSVKSFDVCPRQPHRQATSCSNLQALRDAAGSKVEPMTRSRSVSAGLTMAGHAVGHCDFDLCEMNEEISPRNDDHTRQVCPGLYSSENGAPKRGTVSSTQSSVSSTQSSVSSTQSSVSSTQSSVSSTQSSVSSTQSSVSSTQSSVSSTQSSVSLTISTSPTSSLSPVYLQLPPSPSPRQLPPPPPSPRLKSAADSNISLFPVSDISGQIKHHHQTSLPHSPTLPTDDAATQRPYLRYTHSVDFLKEAAQPAVSWGGISCQGNLSDASPHSYIHQHSLTNTDPPSHYQQMLTHTHSCPIFEPITSYKLLLPQLCSAHNSHYLRKVASSMLEDRLDFVSRIHRQADNFHRNQYLV